LLQQKKYMADNYLEKKMEEHRNGGTARKRANLSPAGRRRGEVAYNIGERTVFVTGGASGIGRAIVKAFCDAGCNVAFCDINTKAGNATAQQTGSRFYPLDVTDTEALRNAIDDFSTRRGGLDIVINNVGIGNFKPFADLTLEDFDHVISTNVKPIIVTSQKLAALRDSASPAYGRIINLASTRATMSEAGTEAYAASKGAIVSLTHALMMSLAPLGITVNCISPGWIDTGDGSALRPIDHTFHPSRRVGTPDDIARLCLWLCLPDNDFVNGENITVDGGVTRMMIYPE
jgi:NAD(P)-dependent dehydrogenase (short-subunit alcohol dehydrogenase family)